MNSPNCEFEVKSLERVQKDAKIYNCYRKELGDVDGESGIIAKMMQEVRQIPVNCKESENVGCSTVVWI